ncbi:hypothetical protein BGZ61DRAFT_375485 [Ilyonectria robusta]|uniref:uncharacterized protein n=1 Tax=Ilyonectria robusta TaxID=1079257 RepID=UPI001E8DB3C8|nr:uncharacterized protein BGZ61DRAFT_375485 [Ilyonectria robusta]KAH8650758.1 hypothetical protein BGZ61DRAFT_375485 [Ilyonectria robusta]
MKDTFVGFPVPRVSQREFCVSGIITTVHGLDELPTAITEVAVLWLLHPRLERSETMDPLAGIAISDWNERCKKDRDRANKGLLAVSIDLRNHGRRQTNPAANQVWRTGNPNHAMDLVAICQGTASDVSLLIDHLPSYIFPSGKVSITQHLCCGVSLGGHITWQLFVGEPRITINIILLGCADLRALLTDRARLSNLPSYADTTPPGDKFIGSRDFPGTLAIALRDIDAAQRIMSLAYGASGREPSEAEAQQVRKSIISERLRGKRLLVVSGGADKMAPYKLTSPVMEFLLQMVGDNSSRRHDSELVMKTVVIPNVQHELTMEMVHEAVNFAVESVACLSPSSSQPASKI